MMCRLSSPHDLSIRNAGRRIYLTTNGSAQKNGFGEHAPCPAAPMRWRDLTRGERRRSDKIGLIAGS